MNEVIQWIWLLVLFIAILWSLYLIGRLGLRLGLRIDQVAKSSAPIGPYKEPEAICGCEHHLCFHDDKGCGQTTNSYDGMNAQWRIINCGCKRYMGPEQLPQVLP